MLEKMAIDDSCGEQARQSPSPGAAGYDMVVVVFNDCRPAGFQGIIPLGAAASIKVMPWKSIMAALVGDVAMGEVRQTVCEEYRSYPIYSTLYQAEVKSRLVELKSGSVP